MNDPIGQPPVAIVAAEAAPRSKASNYPEPYASMMKGRIKRALGDVFGLANFGVNLTTLIPGGISALRHAHSRQDEFVYILSGHPTLITDTGATELAPGMCAGFKAGTGKAHHLVNGGGADVVYLEIGDRSPGDQGEYPDDDIAARMDAGRWTFMRKDGSPFAPGEDAMPSQARTNLTRP